MLLSYNEQYRYVIIICRFNRTSLLEQKVYFTPMYFSFYTGTKHELEKVGEAKLALENSQVKTRSEFSTAEESVLESW